MTVQSAYLKELAKDPEKLQVFIEHILNLDDENVKSLISELMTMVFLLSDDLSEKLEQVDFVRDRKKDRQEIEEELTKILKNQRWGDNDKWKQNWQDVYSIYKFDSGLS